MKSSLLIPDEMAKEFRALKEDIALSMKRFIHRGGDFRRIGHGAFRFYDISDFESEDDLRMEIIRLRHFTRPEAFEQVEDKGITVFRGDLEFFNEMTADEQAKRQEKIISIRAKLAETSDLKEADVLRFRLTKLLRQQAVEGGRIFKTREGYVRAAKSAQRSTDEQHLQNVLKGNKGMAIRDLREFEKRGLPVSDLIDAIKGMSLDQFAEWKENYATEWSSLFYIYNLAKGGHIAWRSDAAIETMLKLARSVDKYLSSTSETPVTTTQSKLQEAYDVGEYLVDVDDFGVYLDPADRQGKRYKSNLEEMEHHTEKLGGVTYEVYGGNIYVKVDDNIEPFIDETNGEIGDDGVWRPKN